MSAGRLDGLYRRPQDEGEVGPVPEVRLCVECGWRFHAVPIWSRPVCIACRFPIYRRSRRASRAWSTREIALRRNPRLSAREIGRRTGRSAPAIRARRWRVVGREWTRRPWSPTEDAAVLRRDRRDAVLAWELGRTVAAIRTRCNNLRQGRRTEPVGLTYRDHGL